MFDQNEVSFDSEYCNLPLQVNHLNLTAIQGDSFLLEKTQEPSFNNDIKSCFLDTQFNQSRGLGKAVNVIEEEQEEEVCTEDRPTSRFRVETLGDAQQNQR